ncbi:uncharacterized protein LOC127566107 [Drosophila albomicans]|uniref:Uncharacterized protein LOC127566107 n=1 Tax=Drosophila albomicans TaxID=7291 RepID=A0A9C6SXK0_DROAB|nr:uncharacterized protein LOC127566107 [Drosophila albomicans]
MGCGNQQTSNRQQRATIQPHLLTIRMHFNFPPCCVQSTRATVMEKQWHWVTRWHTTTTTVVLLIVVVVELLQKCETANVKHNTEVNAATQTNPPTLTATTATRPTR